METTIDFIVTDMGNGCALCGHCEYNLDGGDSTKKLPKNCPKCNADFVGYTEFINIGGSDF